MIGKAKEWLRWKVIGWDTLFLIAETERKEFRRKK